MNTKSINNSVSKKKDGIRRDLAIYKSISINISTSWFSSWKKCKKLSISPWPVGSSPFCKGRTAACLHVGTNKGKVCNAVSGKRLKSSGKIK